MERSFAELQRMFDEIGLGSESDRAKFSRFREIGARFQQPRLSRYALRLSNVSEASFSGDIQERGEPCQAGVKSSMK